MTTALIVVAMLAWLAPPTDNAQSVVLEDRRSLEYAPVIRRFLTSYSRFT